MENLQALKSRLNAVGTIKKITKAMKLVATAKFQRLKTIYAGKKEYFDTVRETLMKIIDVSGEAINDVFPKDAKDSTLYVIITSDIGMCGAYNSNVIKLFKGEYRAEKDHLITIGNKGFSFASYNKITVDESIANIGDDVSYLLVTKLTDEILKMYMTGQVNKVKVVFSKYVNSVTFVPTVTQLFPLEVKEHEEEIKSRVKVNADFEPDAKTIFESSLDMFTSAILYGMIFESKIVEMATRRNSMETATDNAEELIETLGLKYNRARQASITQELVEIVAGSESK